ncbi:MAG: DUF2157 domain-containing protein [Steroidobacteraceae bacterium]
MHRLETEYQQLHAAGVLDEAATLRAVALDRGRIFSLHSPLRLALYASVAAITTGVGLLIKNNLDRIGPVTLMAGLLLIALLCYASAERIRRRSEPRSIGGDYVLLLGALILSADLGYAESYFHWLGERWSWHLLMLAVLHAATAYYFNSRLVLSTSLAALAGWFGVQPNFNDLFAYDATLRRSGINALLCAGVIMVWREIHLRTLRAQPFVEVLEHFAANLAFWGTLALSFDNITRWAGILMVIALAGISIIMGLNKRKEAFVVYGICYGALGLCVFEANVVREELAVLLLALITIITAASLLWRFHAQLKATP